MAAGSKVLDLPMCGDFFASWVRATVMVINGSHRAIRIILFVACIAASSAVEKGMGYDLRVFPRAITFLVLLVIC